jgi:hypothetical protein
MTTNKLIKNAFDFGKELTIDYICPKGERPKERRETDVSMSLCPKDQSSFFCCCLLTPLSLLLFTLSLSMCTIHTHTYTRLHQQTCTPNR